jgi:hypothetical protein
LASSSQASFYKDYIPPRKYITLLIKVPTDGKYLLVTSLVSPGVSIEGDMLGKVVGLKFKDHIISEKKFLDMAKEK